MYKRRSLRKPSNSLDFASRTLNLNLKFEVNDEFRFVSIFTENLGEFNEKELQGHVFGKLFKRCGLRWRYLQFES